MQRFDDKEEQQQEIPNSNAYLSYYNDEAGGRTNAQDDKSEYDIDDQFYEQVNKKKTLISTHMSQPLNQQLSEMNADKESEEIDNFSVNGHLNYNNANQNLNVIKNDQQNCANTESSDNKHNQKISIEDDDDNYNNNIVRRRRRNRRPRRFHYRVDATTTTIKAANNLDDKQDLFTAASHQHHESQTTNNNNNPANNNKVMCVSSNSNSSTTKEQNSSIAQQFPTTNTQPNENTHRNFSSSSSIRTNDKRARWMLGEWSDCSNEQCFTWNTCKYTILISKCMIFQKLPSKKVKKITKKDNNLTIFRTLTFLRHFNIES